MSRKMRGFTMIEVLIIGTIMGVVVAFTGTLILQVYRNQRKDEISSIYTVLRDNFVDQFRDPNSWKEIWAHNNATISTAAWSDVTVYGADGNLYMNYNPNVASNGFNLNGELCNTYNAAAPDPNCPFRLVFRWRQKGVNAGSCAGVTEPCAADIDVEARAQVAQGATTTVHVINPDKFYLPFTRSGSYVTVQQLTCPAGQLVQGFDNNGNPMCVAASSVDNAANPPPPPAILAVGGPAVGEPAVGGPAAGSPAPKSPAKGK